MEGSEDAGMTHSLPLGTELICRRCRLFFQKEHSGQIYCRDCQEERKHEHRASADQEWDAETRVELINCVNGALGKYGPLPFNEHGEPRMSR